MSLFEDTYKTIAEPAQGVFKDKGSKFLAYAYPFKDQEDLKKVIFDVKLLHPKARHHCWAYRLSNDRSVFRINDDGEPSGTAGRPILNALLSQDLTNIIIIVVRYFGGTLLGVPGLIHAYKSATLDALASAKIIECTVNDVYNIQFSYLQMNDVMRIIKDNNLQVISQSFDSSCQIQVEIRKLEVNRIIAKLSAIDEVKLDYLRTL